MGAKLWNKSFVLLILLGVVTGMCSQMVTPVVSKYAVSIGASLTIAATISSLMSIASLACRPISGIITDRINRRTLMIISCAFTALSVGGYAVINSIPALVAMRIVHGIAFSFMSVANMAFATHFIPSDRLGEGLGYYALSGIFSQAAGPSVGLWLIQNSGYNSCFLVSAALSLVAVFVIYTIPNEAPTKIQTVAKRKIHFSDLVAPELLVYALLISLFSMGNGLLNTYLAMMGEERGIKNIALFFTAYSAMLVLIRPLSGRLLDKKGIVAILYPAFIIHAVGMVLVGFARNVWMIVAAGILKAIGQGSGTPSIQAYCVGNLGRERAGVASSTCFIGQDIGNAISPILGSFVVSSFGYTALFCGYAAIVAVGGCGIFALVRLLQQREKKELHHI